MSVPVQNSIVSTLERPEFVPLVARWLGDAFWRAGGRSLEHVLDAVKQSATARPMPRTFILLVDGDPVGTASLGPVGE